MSKVFGLDWRKYDYSRMKVFTLFMQIENKLANTKQK